MTQIISTQVPNKQIPVQESVIRLAEAGNSNQTITNPESDNFKTSFLIRQAIPEKRDLYQRVIEFDLKEGAEIGFSFNGYKKDSGEATAIGNRYFVQGQTASDMYGMYDVFKTTENGRDKYIVAIKHNFDGNIGFNIGGKLEVLSTRDPMPSAEEKPLLPKPDPNAVKITPPERKITTDRIQPSLPSADKKTVVIPTTEALTSTNVQAVDVKPVMDEPSIVIAKTQVRPSIPHENVSRSGTDSPIVPVNPGDIEISEHGGSMIVQTERDVLLSSLDQNRANLKKQLTVISSMYNKHYSNFFYAQDIQNLIKKVENNLDKPDKLNELITMLTTKKLEGSRGNILTDDYAHAMVSPKEMKELESAFNALDSGLKERKTLFTKLDTKPEVGRVSSLVASNHENSVLINSSLDELLRIYSENYNSHFYSIELRSLIKDCKRGLNDPKQVAKLACKLREKMNENSRFNLLSRENLSGDRGLQLAVKSAFDTALSGLEERVTILKNQT